MERHSRTLRELSQELPRARESSSYWDHATHVLSRNGKDIPFALLYSTDSDGSDCQSNKVSSTAEREYQCTLRGSIGLPGTLPNHLTKIDMRSNAGFLPYFDKSLLMQTPVVINLDEDVEVARLVQGIQWQGFGHASKLAVVFPLQTLASSGDSLGFVVLGLSKCFPVAEVSEPVLKTARSSTTL